MALVRGDHRFRKSLCRCLSSVRPLRLPARPYNERAHVVRKEKSVPAQFPGRFPVHRFSHSDHGHDSRVQPDEIRKVGAPGLQP